MTQDSLLLELANYRRWWIEANATSMAVLAERDEAREAAKRYFGSYRVEQSCHEAEELILHPWLKDD